MVKKYAELLKMSVPFLHVKAELAEALAAERRQDALVDKCCRAFEHATLKGARQRLRCCC